MGSANFCPVCGDIVGGWQEEGLMLCKCDDSIGYEEGHEHMSDADRLVEQFDFAIDAVVEVRNYMRNIQVYLSEIPPQSLNPVDRARVFLASARLTAELEESFSNADDHEAEEAEQVRSDSNGGGRYSVPFEAGGSEVSGTQCPFGPWTYHESGPPDKFSRSLAWHGGEQDEFVLHVRR